MKNKLITLFTAVTLLCSAAFSNAETVLFTWDANTEANISGYKLYCNTTNVQPYTLVATTTTNTYTATIDLSAATNYCAVTAYNDYGLESEYSNVVVLYPFVKPAIPKNLAKKKM